MQRSIRKTYNFSWFLKCFIATFYRLAGKSSYNHVNLLLKYTIHTSQKVLKKCIKSPGKVLEFVGINTSRRERAFYPRLLDIACYRKQYLDVFLGRFHFYRFDF